MDNLNSCLNCGSMSWKEKYTFKHTNKKILECQNCHLMVVSPFPSRDELNDIYNENYFNNTKLLEPNTSGIYGYVDYVSERINKQYGYKIICEKINKYLIDEMNSPKILDFGCGLGHFIDVAFDYGYSTNGVEFNQYAIDYINNRYRYHVESFDDFNWADNKFDVITAFDVIEHLREPLNIINKFNAALNTNGLLIISTTDSKSLVSRIIGQKLEDFRRLGEHIYFFSRKNLSDILIKHGFNILEIKSHGHTFELAHLINRIQAPFPLFGLLLSSVLRPFPLLQKMNIYLNPRTKMVIYAQKKVLSSRK